MSVKKKSLILIHPAVTTTPDLLESVKKDSVFAGSEELDQFLINKLNDSSVTLESEVYDVIYYVTPEKDTEIKFPTKLIGVLAQGLKNGGKLYGLSDVYKVDALINGFEIVSGDQGGYYWTKNTTQEKVAAVALRPRKTGASQNAGKALPSFKKSGDEAVNTGKSLPSFKKASGGKLPVFKKAESPRASLVAEDLDTLEDENDSDDLTASKSKFFDDIGEQDSAESIDEDELVQDGEDSKITLVECGKTKTRRRKACKDCTCGLKEAEDQANDAARVAQDRILGKEIKFNEQELTEIDFTIQGKEVGGCGSCALGDAFRCSGCPYLGLPAFKPGQAIGLDTIDDDL